MIVVHFHQRMRGGATEVRGVEGLIGWLIWVGLEQKAWGVFALLFGAGFAILLRRCEARGESVVPIFLRRLVALYLIGFGVEALTRFTVLRDYAWWGIPLLFVRKWPTGVLLALALASAVAVSVREIAPTGYKIVTQGLEATASAERKLAAKQQAARQRAQRAQAAKQKQSTATAQTRPATGAPAAALAPKPRYGEVVLARAKRMVETLPDYAARRLIPGVNLALFLFGFLAVRQGVLDDPRRHARVIGLAMALGFVLWAAAWTLGPQVPAEVLTVQIGGQVRRGFGIVND